MRDQEEQQQPFLPSSAEEQDSSAQRKHPALRLLWAGIVVVVALSGWIAWLNIRPDIQPLRADANTLYLADWSKTVDNWSGGDEWHWKAPGIISSEYLTPPTYPPPPPEAILFLAPYHPTDADIEIDAQIKSLDWGDTFVGEGPNFGVVVGMDSQDMGYLCAELPNFFSHVIDWSGADITGYSGIGEAHDDFTHYVTFTVKIQHQKVTLYLDGQWIAQATFTGYQPGGSVGLLSTYGAIEVQGFRVEKLP